MASVHEMLYKSSDFSKIEYQTYLNTLISGLVNSIKGESEMIKIDINAHNLNLNIDTSIPLGLLITELVTNSLKHGLPRDEEGEIYVNLSRQEDNSLLLKIGDNGIGLPEDFDIENSDSLGLQLVQSLIEQLSGSCKKDKSKNGTHIIIEFREQN